MIIFWRLLWTIREPEPCCPGRRGEIETLPSPMEAFREFYQIMQQQPLSEEEEAVIQEILVKIGGETE